MSLGASDALGIPSTGGSIYPSKVKVTGFNTVAGSNLSYFTTVIRSDGNGQIERQVSVGGGDRFIIKQAGVYAISLSLIMATNAGQIGIFKNLSPTLGATNPVDIAAWDANRPELSENTLCLWVASVAGQRANVSTSAWLDSGDYIQLSTSQALSPADTSQFFSIEKIAG